MASISRWKSRSGWAAPQYSLSPGRVRSISRLGLAGCLSFASSERQPLLDFVLESVDDLAGDRLLLGDEGLQLLEEQSDVSALSAQELVAQLLQGLGVGESGRTAPPALFCKRRSSSAASARLGDGIFRFRGDPAERLGRADGEVGQDFAVEARFRPSSTPG